ncbi:MAG: thiamine phosphate synthase [Tepidiformaceae bacterium]
MSGTIGRLHVITDVIFQTRYTHGELAALAVTGGADVIQWREKRPLTTRQLMADAAAVAEACESTGALAIIDDRADVAAAVGARGLHLGAHDLPVAVARELLGEDCVIGGTANSLAEARKVWRTPIDYIGVGPIFGTASKAHPAPVMGLVTLAAIVAESPVPVIAIGNVTADWVEDVLETGAYGVAVLSGLTCAADPTAAARIYWDRIQRWFARRGEV